MDSGGAEAGVPGIPAFFAGRHVLVTGGTGFLGKVLLEKMLRCCPDVARIYVVVRTKRGQAAAERIDAMRSLPLFEPLLKKNPAAFDKLHALEGETSQVDMGLSEEDKRLVREKVSVVFHLAAALNWRSTLRKATIENVKGTKCVLDFCQSIENLVAFEYTSTAFCQCAEDVLEERTYPSPFDPHKLIELTGMLDEPTMEIMTKSLYGPHPNCYTYTKAVAEGLTAEYADSLPIVIVRPSIVTPSLREPIPGWVDTLNGPVGVLAAGGKGVLRSMMCRAENHAEVFPVDLCVNALIAATYKRALMPRRMDNLLVYNASSGGEDHTTWAEVLEMGRKKVVKYPFEWTIWYPDGGIRSNWWTHTLVVLLFQMVPAYLIDLLLLLAGQERFMVRVQRKIKSGTDLLTFFTMREWKFENHNGRDSLWPNLQPEDQQTFFLNNVLPVDKEDYIDKAIFGTRTYCLKESPETLKYCRARLRVQLVVHRLAVALFYMGVVYWLLLLACRVLLPIMPIASLAAVARAA